MMAMECWKTASYYKSGAGRMKRLSGNDVAFAAHGITIFSLQQAQHG
jgi:hypothetical protein